MSQVSKYPISKAVEEECLNLLHTTISSLHGKQEIKEFLDDFLSPIERIMLAKRLGIAVLLGKGYTYDQIRKVLRVTPPTISMVSMAMKYTGKGYRHIVDMVIGSERWNEFWQRVDDFLADILPPKGKDWSYWRRERWQRKIKTKKAF